MLAIMMTTQKILHRTAAYVKYTCLQTARMFEKHRHVSCALLFNA